MNEENGELRVKVARLEEQVRAADKALTVAQDMHHFMWALLLNFIGTVIGIGIGLLALLRH
jgi:hypothetical protein